jgi:hypothetical protein
LPVFVRAEVFRTQFGNRNGHAKTRFRMPAPSVVAAITAAIRGLDSKMEQRISGDRKIRDRQHLEIP